MATTWKPVDEHGQLSSEDRKELPDSAYAFPGKRKEPMTDADHVRNALARFDQTKGVNIKKAAKHYKIDMTETDWRQLGKKPHTPNTSK